MSAIYTPSLARRALSRSAPAIGLRYYDVLDCERDLAAAIPEPKPAIPLDVCVADGNDVEAMLALR